MESKGLKHFILVEINFSKNSYCNIFIVCLCVFVSSIIVSMFNVPFAPVSSSITLFELFKIFDIAGMLALIVFGLLVFYEINKKHLFVK